MSNIRSEYLSQFFQPDGRTVILPIDHGIAVPTPGLEHPGDLIADLSPFVDGFVVNFGLAQRFHDALADKGICLRTDAYNPRTSGRPGAGSHLLYGVEEALECGAHAMMNMLFPGGENDAAILADCAELVRQSLDVGLPLIIEALPVGLGQLEHYTVDNVAFAARQAAEIGADVVKTVFPPGASADDFRRVVDPCFVPLIVLGGAPLGDDSALLSMVRCALDAGAAGIAIGRNVWQHPKPTKIAQALHALVHDDATVPSALKHLA